MIQTLNPYPSYSEHETPWFNKLPSNWRLVPNQAVLIIRNRKVGDKSSDFTLLSLTLQGIIPRDLDNPQGKFPASFDTYKIVEPDDLVFCLFDIDETPRTIGYSSFKGMITGAYTVTECTEVALSRYYYYFYLSLDHRKALKPYYTGLRKTIATDRFMRIKVPLPPHEEHVAIVRFLDYANHRIRQYIHNKRKLIKLLEEQKQAIIHQTVARGLDPDVSFKDSGVDWLGEVPEHWDVVRLRNVVEMRVSNVDKHIKEGEHPVRLCNYVDVYKNDQITKTITFMEATATEDEITRFRLEKRDVLITKDSETWDDIGVPALVDYTAPDLICGYHLALLRPHRNRIHGTYLLRAIQSTAIQYQFHILAKGVTRYGLSHGAIKSIWMPIPPPPEQEAISKYIGHMVNQFDQAISKAKQEIALLPEYQKRLIADVVTGMIDVREAVAALPEFLEDFEWVDEGTALEGDPEEFVDVIESQEE